MNKILFYFVPIEKAHRCVPVCFFWNVICVVEYNSLVPTKNYWKKRFPSPSHSFKTFL